MEMNNVRVYVNWSVNNVEYYGVRRMKKEEDFVRLMFGALNQEK